MLRFDDALARILALAPPPPPVGDRCETVSLDEADGRVLAEDAIAGADVPGCDYSAMDGYALRASDVTAGAPLPVRGESRTGAVAPALEAGTAMRIFTGAALPAGADSVVMQEDTSRDFDTVIIAKAPRHGQHVRRRGDDLAAGAVALARGVRLRPAHLALLAALDRSHVLVAKRPVVSIVATGDELRAPGSPARPGTIPESNTVALRAMARRAGAEARPAIVVRDDRRATERALAEALETSDVVVTVGGVSVGDHDLVRPALDAVGVALDFWRVAIKPGKPLAIGTKTRSGGGGRSSIVVGLPGNPASAIVTFALFGIPLLRALEGDAERLPARIRAKLGAPVTRAPGRLSIVRAHVARTEAGLIAMPIANQASGAVTSVAHADAFVLVPEDSTALSAGDEVDVLAMSDLCA